MSKISIAMATYNGGRYLREQLDSFLDQTRRPDELVVCDDQSSDDTAEILARFADRAGFPVRFFRNEQRLGILKNFEKAITLCSGDLIFFSDQDDVWHKEKLRRHEEVYDADETVGMVFSDALVVDDALKPTGKTTFEAFKLGAWERSQLQGDRAVKVLLENSRVTGCTASFRAHFRAISLPIDEKVLHDEWIALVVATLSRIRCLPEPLVSYRQHQSQALGAGDKKARPGEWVPSRRFLLENRAAILTNLYLRLSRMDGPGRDAKYRDSIEYLAGWIALLWRRALYPDRLWKRLPSVALEFLSGNYARYFHRVKDALSYDLKPRYYR